MTFEPANQGNVYGNPGYTPPPPPRSGGNRTLWIVLGCGCLFVLLCSCLIGGSVLLGGGTFAALIGATQPAVEQSDRFLGALRDGNWQAAFDLCTSEFQRELGQPQRLQQFVTQGNRRPQTWTVTNRQVNNDEAQIDGTMEFQGGARGTFRVVLDREGATWRVAGLTLNPGGR